MSAGAEAIIFHAGKMPALHKTMPPQAPKGWYSRGYIPHLDHPGLIQGITFHLADSLPAKILEAQKEIVKIEPDVHIELHRKIQKCLDKGYGVCYLKQPQIATMVEQALWHFDGERYRLLAWVIMPNHVHAVIETFSGHPLSALVHSWKSFTGGEANRLLKRSGTFWQREYFDRYIRDEEHFNRAVYYVHQNPVKAGLVEKAEDFPFSSVRLLKD